MDIIKNFLTMAMEAGEDDISNTNVLGAVREGPDGGGTDNTNINRNAPSNAGDTRNVPENKSTPPETPTSDTGADDMGDIDMGDDDFGDEEGGEDGMNDEGEDMSMNEDDLPQEDPTEVTLKNRVLENMIMLYRIIDHELEVLRDFIARNDIVTENRVLFKISSNLTDLKTILFNQITIGFQTKSYENLMKTYVAISKIYDIAIKMLITQYENTDKK